MRLAKVIENFEKQTYFAAILLLFSISFHKKIKKSYTIGNIYMLHQQIIDNENRERSAFPIF